MKPVTHRFVPFTLDRLPSIRLGRELYLAEGLELHIKKKKARIKKEKAPKRKSNLVSRAEESLSNYSAEAQAEIKKLLGLT